MATTSNTYTGNGSNKLFSITFPYLETTDIFVFVNGTNTTAYTFANATTIEMTTAPANGATVYIARATNDTALQATFFPGSSIKAADLNLDFDKVLYIAQETTNEAQAATFTSNLATTTANTALSQSAAAVSTANTASSNASAAVATANTANSNASAAVSTANTASSNASAAVSTANAAAVDAATAISTANGAVSTANAATSTANTALSNSTAAVSTANTASSNATAAVSTANTASTNASNAVTTANSAVTTANGAVTTANTADTNSNTAITTANAAAAAVANAVLYTTVANVAAIPVSPANNAAVEVANSTGIESFTPLSGLPAGFIGSSGLSVRIIYQTSGATWTWIQYFPNDPETRYLGKAGGTMTGALTFAGAQPTATTSAANIVQLTDSTSSTSVTTAATPASVKTANDAAVAAQSTANTAVTDAAAAQSTANTAVTNAATAQTTANAALPKSGGAMTGDLTLNAQSDVRFADADSSNWVAFQAPSTVASNVTWTLPSADATVSGFALVSDASGTLSWAAAGGGATGGSTDQVFFENDQTVTTSYTLTANKNAMTAGPVTVANGAIVTIPSNASWIVL